MVNDTVAAFNATTTSNIPSALELFRPQVELYIIVTVTVGFGGALLILLLLCAMALGTQTRGGANILIVNLLLAEFIMCSSLVPHQAFSIYFPFARIEQTGCRYNYVIWMILMSYSQWLTCALAVNRVVATLAPHYYYRTASGSAIGLTIVFCWAVACACFLPFFFNTGGYYDSLPPWMSCSIRTSLPWAKLAMYTVGFYAPMAIMGTCYALILLYVVGKRLRRPLGGAAGGDVFSQAERQRLAIARMLMASALWYYACYLPNTIVATSFYPVYVRYPLLQLWLRTIFFLGYGGNPLIFFTMCKDYRNGLRSLGKRLRQTVGCAAKRPLSCGTVTPVKTTLVSVISAERSRGGEKDAAFGGVYYAADEEN
ncbi:rhodopsin-like isoform X2 [Paramacrobiotus metropolitanus]|uniref:rhodopsin-like isoform X1 n=1 Tax=Paramacrobiotus metropolitanus TaxID=2943436 RepID=UPI00244577FC|nr:rhodopsin-like isoform X1 [Paramacrobiotus metropolitanus]XP_055355356.1 rhodopsin-like isoform X1 [Paramacrobiotus metropolitanus]XP_055355357.1 rhodopsin-like isoform X2 [Paramacrobiotus metropolitanus]